MKISLLEGLLDLLNKLPFKYGVSDTLSPSKIVEGRPKVDTGQKKNIFCSYAMVQIDKTNTTRITCVP